MVMGERSLPISLKMHSLNTRRAMGRAIKFNWSSLTVVDFRQASNVLPILRETINWVELGRDPGSLIHLPRLERLSINEVAFLTILETPSLQRLKLDFTNCFRSDIDGAGIAAAFLRRWGIKLSATNTRA